MKKAEGFLTDDGTFFENEAEAVLYEAETRLRGRLGVEFPQLNQEKFFVIILSAMPEMRSYIDAYGEANHDAGLNAEESEEDDLGSQTSIGNSAGHVSSAEKDIASVLQLPPGRPSNVSNVGRRSRSKAVSDKRKVDGA